MENLEIQVLRFPEGKLLHFKFGVLHFTFLPSKELNDECKMINVKF